MSPFTGREVCAVPRGPSFESLRPLAVLTVLLLCAGSLGSCSRDSADTQLPPDPQAVAAAICEKTVLQAALATFGGSNAAADEIQRERGIESVEFRAYREAVANTDATRIYYAQGSDAAATQIEAAIRVSCESASPEPSSSSSSDNACGASIRSALRAVWIENRDESQVLTDLAQQFGTQSTEYRGFLLILGDQDIGRIRIDSGGEVGLGSASARIDVFCRPPSPRAPPISQTPITDTDPLFRQRPEYDGVVSVTENCLRTGRIYLPGMASNPAVAQEIISRAGADAGTADAYWLDPLGKLVDAGGPYEEASLLSFCSQLVPKS